MWQICLSFGCLKAKTFLPSGGFTLWPLPGTLSCPGPRWGLCSQITIIGSRSPCPQPSHFLFLSDAYCTTLYPVTQYNITYSTQHAVLATEGGSSCQWWAGLWNAALCITHTSKLRVEQLVECGSDDVAVGATWRVEWHLVEYLHVVQVRTLSHTFLFSQVHPVRLVQDLTRTLHVSSTGAQYCHQLACLSFVCLSAYLKNHTSSKFHQIFCTCYLRPWLDPLTAMRYIAYLWFCGWRHVLINRTKSKTTRMFRPVHQVATLVKWQMTLFCWDRQVAVPGAKSAVSNCIFYVSKN